MPVGGLCQRNQRSLPADRVAFHRDVAHSVDARITGALRAIDDDAAALADLQPGLAGQVRLRDHPSGGDHEISGDPFSRQ